MKWILGLIVVLGLSASADAQCASCGSSRGAVVSAAQRVRVRVFQREGRRFFIFRGRLRGGC